MTPTPAAPTPAAPTPAALLERHADAWTAATRHPFLDGVRDGTLPDAALDAWLVQDHLFVADLTAFQARLLPRVAPTARPVLLAGLGALVAELAWFQDLAAARELDLDVPRDATTAAYAGLLDDLLAGPPAAALAALWAVERAYLEGWSSAAPGAQRYEALVEHWTTPAFAGYVADLEVAATAAVAGTGPDADLVAGAVERAVVAVAGLEERFWGTALRQGQP